MFSTAASVGRTVWSVPLVSAASSSDLSGRRCEAYLSFAAKLRSLSPESSRPNADDRLSVDPLSRVEGSDRFVEGRDSADVRPHPSVTHPTGDLT